ncbi:MAG: single-stranded DNA-binding protein [Thainema sp.]
MKNEEFYERWLLLQQQQTALMERIAIALERMAPDDGAPNLQKSIEEFKGFDWPSIGARVVQSDQYGPAIVEWGGKQFTRRSPQNKFSAAIWFSRSTGVKDSEGRPIYERLISFKVLEGADPVSAKAAQHLN